MVLVDLDSKVQISFYSTGGMASLTECLYHATPLLAIPFANDQKQHMLRAQRLGYAAFVDWEGLGTEGLLVALKTTLEDKQMAARLQQVGVYCMCTNYDIKHGKCECSVHFNVKR